MTRLLVEARAAGLLVASATPSAMEGVLALLQTTLGPDGPAWFAAIGAGDVVPRKKPAPDIQRWVLARLGVAAREAPAIENSAPGLAAARGAELTTAITVNDYTRGQDLADAALVLSDPGGPRQPFGVLRGDANGFDRANVAALRAWHGWAAGDGDGAV